MLSSTFCKMFGFVVIFPLFLMNANTPNVNARVEQRVTLKFLVKSGKSPIESWRDLQAVWGERTMSKTQVRMWHKRFKEGSDNTADAPRPGRPRTQRTDENIETIRGLIDHDPRQTIMQLSDCTGISTHVVRTILKTDLGLKCKCARFIPRDLTEPQKWACMTVAQDNLDLLCSKDDPEHFLRSIVTGDETWVSTYEPDSKQQSSVWIGKNQERPTKARSASVRKSMLTVFFDCRGIVHMEFLGPRETVTAERYILTLSKLKKSIRKKCPELWHGRQFLIHHDNASPHTAKDTLDKLALWGVSTLPHPAYSPDLAPCDFALFPKLKGQIRGKYFRNLKELQDECRKVLMSFPVSLFEDAMHDMVLWWQKCSNVNGDYFEGLHISVDPLFAKGNESETSSSSSDDE